MKTAAQMESDDDGETITVMMIPPTGPGGISLFSYRISKRINTLERTDVF